MKTILTLVLSLLLASSAVYAEKGPGKGEGQRSGERMARMQEHLGLSDEQVEQMREIRANGGSREEMRSVLTEEQREKMRAHHKARKQGGGKGRYGSGEGRNAPDEED